MTKIKYQEFFKIVFKYFKKIFPILLAFIVLGGWFLLAQHVFAQAGGSLDVGLAPIKDNIGLPTTDIRLIAARIIRVALGMLGIVAVVIILYAGYTWMTAGGNSEKIDQAKKIMVNAVIGLAIILSSFAIVSFVISRLMSAATGLPAHCYNGVQDEDETGVDTGGSCGDLGGGGGQVFTGANTLYVSSLPGKNACILNPHPTIIFSLPVDVATVSSSVVIQEVLTSSTVPGAWKYGAYKNEAEFVPAGSCAPAAGNDCLRPNTDYVLTFKTPLNIKTLDGKLTLNCLLKRKCDPAFFRSGDKVDVTPPTINLRYPSEGSAFAPGMILPITADFTDDNGVQNIAIYASVSSTYLQVNNANSTTVAYTRVGDPELVDSKSFDNCERSGALTVSWNTTNAKIDKYIIEGNAKDWAGRFDTDFRAIIFRPQFCFNDKQDGDETGIDCGGSCGACAGANCQYDIDCAGGYCDKNNGAAVAVCVDKVQITRVEPFSGAPGSWVTVNGRALGSDPGQIYFSRVNNPSPTNLADWILAPRPQNCGDFDTWTNNYIITEVPAGAIDGPMMVVTKPVAGLDGVARTFFDTTKDAWGPIVGGDGNFRVTNVLRPGLCGVNPATGNAGDTVVFYGKNFGLLDNAGDKVYFGAITTTVAAGKWGDTVITSAVPTDNIAGQVTVQVSNNNIKSNNLPFIIKEGVGESAPVISGVTPVAGAFGEYITITGKNFGNLKGQVWFKSAPSGVQAINGDFNFPKECGASVWKDNQVIVKFPLGQGSIGTKYTIQINTADNKNSSYNSNYSFRLTGGSPAPGLCKISPVSGPVPFPAGRTMLLVGEYFKPSPASSSDVYYWKAGASPTTTIGRLAANRNDLFTITGSQITARPVTGTESGPVAAYRPSDGKISNPLNFAALDCTKNNNTCSGNDHCCTTGIEKGFCKAEGDACDGTLLSTGYVWKFSTKDIPSVPHVVERCDSNTDLGRNFPSPAPSVIWDANSAGDHHNVCKTALVNVEFSTLLDQATIDVATVKINRCTSVDGNNCQNPVPVTLAPNSLTLKSASPNSHRLELAPVQFVAGESWSPDTWYQVVLSKNIKSAGTVTSTTNLASDKPCTNDNTSAYCFVFRSDNRDCKLKSVLVSPISYWTNRLEAPVSVLVDAARNKYQPVEYWGNGLSDQHCVMMDVSGYNWDWEVAQNRILYADIYQKKSNSRAQKVSALGNTVAIGLANPDDAANIEATASTDTPNGFITKTGVSPLTIDLSNPSIVEAWPNCLEVCTNAEVGVRFNVSMSTKNLDDPLARQSVRLLKCTDPNCLTTQVVNLAPGSIKFEVGSKNTVLKIANAGANPDQLEPDTLYQVILSTSSTDPNAANRQLWSAAQINQWAKAAKPLNEEYRFRFRTKKDRCQIARVEVDPTIFNAIAFNDRAVFRSVPYSSPDSCSARGQKLNPWTIDWTWQTSDAKVAEIDTFKTIGQNPYCTANCIRKGSSIPATANANVAICGNGKVEAGEDCDKPNKQNGCGLDCRFLGTLGPTCGNGVVDNGEACDLKDPRTALGCSSECRHQGSDITPAPGDVNASICGKDGVSAGEDCDIGIGYDINNRLSSAGCSARCLHTGTKLASKWCAEDSVASGFSATEVSAACKFALSQCGNKIEDPDEDPGCDDPVKGKQPWCDNNCLIIDGSVKLRQECQPNEAGCNENGQHIGSSLSYTPVSSCGDVKTGIGEDPFCETKLSQEHVNLFDPWVLARGIGTSQNIKVGPNNTKELRTAISAATTVNNKAITGSGDFIISCGYQSDADCEAIDPKIGLGLASNSCCQARLAMTATVPAAGAKNVCPNTEIDAHFDGQISQKTVTGNTTIVKKVSAKDCGSDEDFTKLLASVTPSQSLPWYQKVYRKIAGLVHRILGSDAAAANDTRWCAVPGLGTPTVIIDSVNTSTSHVNLKLTKALDATSEYAVVLKTGVRDVFGVTVARPGNQPISWKFTTSDKICEVNNIAVLPANVYFSRANATSTLIAKARTASNAIIQPIAGLYSWEYKWGPLNHSSVSVSNTTTSDNLITAQNRNGELDIYAAAVIKDNKVTSVTGTVATGRSHAVVFICENPWPPKDLLVNGKNTTIFPYEDKLGNNDAYDLNKDTFTGGAIPASSIAGSVEKGEGYYNFATYYCADNGSTGTYDDLPILRPTVQIDNKIVSASSSLKRFIFTNYNNSDAIGIQVFNNANHLTPEEWFHAASSSGGQGFVGALQNTTVDTLDAVTDGNNIYVDVIDYSPTYQAIYSNIYLFSINNDARPETRKVFDQLIKNLRFNSNLTNYGYCGVAIDKPDFNVLCKSDLDCTGGQICSVQTDKLRRDYERLHDLRQIDNILEAYAKGHGGKYPDLKEGTYLSGQNISTWSEWAVLSKAAGATLPKDPINRLGKAGTCTPNTNVFCTADAQCRGGSNKCTLHDPTTGWSVTDRRFSFACATSSLAYRYIASPATSTNYTLRLRIEDPGLRIVNDQDFINSFKYSKADRFMMGPQGICNQDQEIATISQGVCGDGVINLPRGEECDGGRSVDLSECEANPANGTVKLKTCSNTCKWQAQAPVTCKSYYASKCGDGKIDRGGGEECDDGELNGRYNKCSKTCTIPTLANPGLGFCGDSVAQPAYEVCDYKKDIKQFAGWCQGGIRDGSACNIDDECWQDIIGATIYYSAFGTCVKLDDAKEKYDYNKADACSFDCQSNGSYCGDGIVQTQYQEQCDPGLVTNCSLSDGRAGKRLCDNTCKFVDNANGWWRFDDVLTEVNIHILGKGVEPKNCLDGSCRQKLADRWQELWKTPVAQAAAPGRYIYKDSSSNKLDGLCNQVECPSITRSARPGAKDGGNGAFFNGDSYIEIPHSDAIMATSAFSVEAWIKPTSFGERWQRVIEKGGWFKDGGYGLETNVENPKDANDASAHRQRFIIWGFDGQARQAVDSDVNLVLNQWAHVVGTYVWQPPAAVGQNGNEVLTIYINGKLAGKNVEQKAKPTFAVSGEPLVVGRSSLGRYAFKGYLDDLKYYSVALTAGDVSDHYSHSDTCQVKPGSIGVADNGAICGNGIVEDDEACDNGQLNDVPCSAVYGKNCSWCRNNCKEIVDVKSEQYCGNGKIESIEKCELAANNILVGAGEGLAAYWKFDISKQADNNTIYTDVVSGFEAACVKGASCPVVEDGNRPGALAVKFNGSTQYLSVPHQDRLMHTAHFSLAMWVKQEDTVDPNRKNTGLIGKGGGRPNGEVGGYALSIEPNADGANFVFTISGISGDNPRLVFPLESKYQVKPNEWTSVVVTYDFQDGLNTSKIYVNGVLDNTATAVSALPYIMANERGLIIGSNPAKADGFDNPADYLKGSLQDIKIYPRALGDQEVARLHSTQLATEPAYNGYVVDSCSDENQAPNTFKKGVKSCANNCSNLNNGCILCGADPINGVKVEGNLLNVLAVSAADPFANIPNGVKVGDLNLFIGPNWNERIDVAHAYGVRASKYHLYQGPDVLANSPQYALISPAPICSVNDGHSYGLVLNTDNNHLPDATRVFDFNVSADKNNLTPWKYDLLLSPVIQQSVRRNDIRVVVSWVRNDQFQAGWVIPEQAQATMLNGGSFLNQWADWQYAANPGNSQKAIWYHGYASTPNQLHEETFTINTADLKTNSYGFYVRTTDANKGMKNFKASAELKVDIYVPELESDEYRYAKPAKTFYLSEAENSNYDQAPYWSVFVVTKLPPNAPAATLQQIIPINRITTEAKDLVKP